ncbi:hypothetical protein CR983_00665 [Candidatus Saccharibacteria bacterium]|nr:MAG: hypothetical protein CR983_00665 [Candidatus Saccharibacteria bacterium]
MRRFHHGHALAYVFVLGLAILILGVTYLRTNTTLSYNSSELRYQQLAEQAADAGLAYAQFCLQKTNSGSTAKPWGDSAGTMLQTASNCDGSAITSTPAPTLVNTPELRTRFTVGALENTEGFEGEVQRIAATGYTEVLSGGSVVRTVKAVKRHTVPRQTFVSPDLHQGIEFSCAISGSRDIPGSNTRRVLFCAGRNDYGQLGNDSTANSTAAVEVARESGVLGEKRVIALATGGFHACTIAADTSNNNHVYCWGRNNKGQLGNGNTTDASKPVEITNSGALNGKRIVTIAASYYNTYALDEEGRLYAWGDGSFSQIGNGSTADVNAPVLISTNGFLDTSGSAISNFYSTYQLDKIATGPRAANVCVIAGGSNFTTSHGAFCWGESQHTWGSSYQTGANGNGSYSTTARPRQIATVGGGIKDIVMDGYFNNDGGVNVETHACLLAADNSIHCWGHNGFNQIGDGTAVGSRPSPTAVATGQLGSNDHVSQLAATGRGMCALKAGEIYCWGRSINGTRTTPTRLTPPAGNPLRGAGATMLSGGSDQMCALSGYRWYCWGMNSQGQLGTGNKNNYFQPTFASVYSMRDYNPDYGTPWGGYPGIRTRMPRLMF